MSERRMDWLEGLLPPAMRTPRSQIWWLLFFALFPLAYVGGVMLETKQESPAMMAGFEDREEAIRTAREFAASKGFPVNGWHQYAVANTDDDLLAYYGDGKDPVLAAANAIAPSQELQVLFRSPDQSHEFRAYLSLLGHVTGYDFGKSISMGHSNLSFDLGSVTTNSTTRASSDDSEMKNALSVSDEEAEAIARRALTPDTELTRLVPLEKPRIDTSDDDPARREVIWKASPVGKPELTLQMTVGVRDAQVVALHIKATVDKKHKVKTAGFGAALTGIYSLFLTFGAVYALIRYARRTLQKEVSHLRTLLVGALFTISYSALIYSTVIDQIATHIGSDLFAKNGLVVYAIGLVTFSLMGLLVGIAYGSGEGEVREAYPGKLTSLDALLAGRIFSRDVGASLLFGAAAAGWLLLFHHAAGHFLKGDIHATRSDVLTYTFSRIPWLTMLVGRQYDSLLIAVTGLLLPASFLVRRTVRKSRRFAWLILFALLSVLSDASKYPTLASSLLAILVLACALLLPFFAFDLLAAMVSLSALSFVEELTRLNAVFPSWNDFTVSLAALVGMALVVATYLALRGTRVHEEDVSPVYARNLAQRMSLQAEVRAAREAQLRLLPQDVPDLPGIQFAACCLPARGVGGDFYDFFRLDAERVGIFVAQGGEQGLASALCIALAKGILMHASLQPHSPTQTLVDLEASLGELLEGGSSGRISFLYAVMDTRRNLLSYARLGDSPQFAAFRQGANVTGSSKMEHVVNVAGRLLSAAPIYESSIPTCAGDFLVFFTRGITSLRAGRFSRREHQWMDMLMPFLSRTDKSLQVSLTEALDKYQNRASYDLTAVILRVLQDQPQSLEAVA